MLALWLPLINNLNNQGLDNAIITNNGATIDTSGKIGSCYSFNGSNSFISVDDSNLYNIIQGGDKPFTIMFWIYHADSTRGVIFGDYGLSGGINFNVELTANHQIRFFWNGGPDKTFTDTTVEINTWVHIVLTYDGNKICMYKNGLLQTDTYEDTLIQRTKISGLFYLGRDSRTGATTLNGRINDFRIYDTALSPREIKEISKGLVLHYPLSREGFGADNIIPNTWPEERTFTYPSSSLSDRFSCITTIVPTASQYTLSFWAKSTVNGDKIRTHFYSPNTTTTCVSNQGITKTASDGNMDFTLSTEWEHYWVTYSQNETTAVKHVICPRMGSVGNTSNVSSGTGTVSIKCIKLEEGDTPTPWIPNSTDSLYSDMGLDSNVVYDVSGFCNNGTKHGAITYDADTPRYIMSAKFDGSSYISRVSPTDQIRTVSFWINTPKTNSTVAFSDLKSKLGFGFNAGGYIIPNCNNTATNEISMYSASSITANEWCHIVLVRDDSFSDVLVYINGVLQTSRASKNYWTHSTDTLMIGKRSTGNGMTCLISDFRAYATELTEEEILELYHTTISLSHNGTLLTQGELSEV